MNIDQPNRKTAGPKKLEPKFRAASKQTAGKSNKKPAAGFKTAAAKNNSRPLKTHLPTRAHF